MSPTNFPGRALLENELAAGEVLVWAGQPDPTRLWQRALPHFYQYLAVAALMPLVLYEVFASFAWSWRSGKISVVDFALLFIALAATAGIAKELRAPWRAREQAHRVFYGITNWRVLIVKVEKGGYVRALQPAEISIKRFDLPEGKGDLSLKRESRGLGENRRTVDIGFWGIENAREVERLLRDTLQRSN